MFQLILCYFIQTYMSTSFGSCISCCTAHTCIIIMACHGIYSSNTLWNMFMSCVCTTRHSFIIFHKLYLCININFKTFMCHINHHITCCALWLSCQISACCCIALQFVSISSFISCQPISSLHIILIHCNQSFEYSIMLFPTISAHIRSCNWSK